MSVAYRIAPALGSCRARCSEKLVQSGYDKRRRLASWLAGQGREAIGPVRPGSKSRAMGEEEDEEESDEVGG